MAAMTVAVRVRVPVQEDDRATLGMWSRSTAIRAGFVTRARIVLAAADGEGTIAIARRLGVTHGSTRLLACHLGIGDATASAGACVAITPIRVFASRWVGVPGVATGILGPGFTRRFSVANARNATGAIELSDAVSQGATALTVPIDVGTRTLNV